MTPVGKMVRIFREEGALAVGAAAQSAFGKWWRQGEIWQLRKAAYVRLDGCRISLDCSQCAEILNLLKTGRYELPERIAVQRYLNHRLPVVELGACIGVVACATNRQLRRKNRHVVVEANPHLIPCLIQNRELNDAGFEVVHRAIGYEGNAVEMHFQPDLPLTGGKHSRGGEVLKICAISLRNILEHRDFERAALICDVEGSEFELVQHEAPVLAERISLLILELHERLLGHERAHFVRKTLANIGFVSIYENHESHVFMNQRLSG